VTVGVEDHRCSRIDYNVVIAADHNPFSVRLRPDVLTRLRQQSRRFGVSGSRLAERFIDEGLRAEEFHGITFRSGPTGRRAALASGPDVWEIVGDYQRAERAGRHPLSTLRASTSLHDDQIALALAYYRAYPHEVDERIRADEEAHARAQPRLGSGGAA
jgi:hypothetical protein